MSRLEVARIAGVHGLRGAVKVELYFSASEALKKGGEVDLTLPSGEERRAKVRSLNAAGKLLLVEFEGVSHRDAALALRGARVFVARSALPALDPGEAYLVDLVGAAVLAPDGIVGEVIEVRVDPSADTLIIRSLDGRVVEQPLVPPFVARVDGANRRVELTSRDGLIE